MPERILTLNLRKYLVTQPRTKRARKAIKFIRERVAHYTKLREENVKISQSLNSLVFKYYSRHMVPVKLDVKIGTDTADVLPFAAKGKQPAAPAPEARKGQEEKAKKPLITKVAPKPAEKPAEKPAQPAPKAPAQQKPASGQ